MKKNTNRIISIVVASILAAQLLVVPSFAKIPDIASGETGILASVAENPDSDGLPSGSSEELSGSSSDSGSSDEASDSSSTPDQTEIPDITETPDGTETPDITETPSETETPDITETPDQSKTPDESEIPEDTTIPEDIVIPDINETPDQGEIQKVEIASFTALPAELANISVKPGTPFQEIAFPDMLEAVDINGTMQTITGVTWICSAYNETESRPENEYYATAVLPEGYLLGEGVSLPEIKIIISEPVSRAINDRIVIGGAVYKEINPTECQLIGFDETVGPVGDLVIPEKITRPSDKKEFSVTAIYQSAFENCQSIGSVTFEGNPVVGAYAFRRSKVTGVNFGSKLTTLGDYAFADTPALERVIIPGTLNNMGSSAFSGSGVKTVIVENGVTGIGSYAFVGCTSLSDVQLPQGLTTIGSSAFQSCSALKTITLPGSLQSFYYAFASSGLENVTLEEGISLVDSYAFYNCGQLKTVILPDSLTTLNSYCFQYCSVLTEIIIPNSVRSLGNNIFYNCTNLKSVQISNQITSIPYEGFRNCTSLEEIILPESVRTIDAYAFRDCIKLSGVTLPQNLNVISDYAFINCSSLVEIEIPPSVSSFGNGAFYGCAKLKEIVLPDQITFISSYMFYNCTALESFKIPPNVTSVGVCAFYGCSSISSIEIPSSVSSFAELVFSGCAKLTDITLPEQIRAISPYMFQNCKLLESIVIPQNITSIENYAFIGSGLKNIKVPSSVKFLGEGIFSDCTSLTETVFAAGNLTISAYTFQGDTALAKVTFQEGPIAGIVRDAIPNNTALKVYVPDTQAAKQVRDSGIDPEKIFIGDQPSDLEPSEFSVDGVVYRVILSSLGENKVSIVSRNNDAPEELLIPEKVSSKTTVYEVAELADSAFSGWYGLRTVTLPDTLERVGKRAFSDCVGLREVNLPESLVTIDEYAFFNCYALKGITLPDGITSIGSYAFTGCTALDNIVIPGKITTISSSAFQNCENLSSVELPSGLMDINSNAFYGCTGLKEISFPKSLKKIMSNAFSNSGLLSLVLPEGVTMVGRHAFSYCNGLQSISLPSTLQYIYEYAFQGCKQLEAVTIPQNVEVVGYYAFQGCTALKEADIKGRIPSYYYNNYDGYSYSTSGIFAGCTAIEKVTLSEYADIIVPSMFSGCTSLNTVELLDDMSYIGSSAFQGCTALTSIALPEKLSSIESNAFFNCTSLTAITLSKTLQSIAGNAFRNTALRNITIPDSITSIAMEAFRDCKELAWAKIGSGLQSIGLNAFPTNVQLIANDPRVQLLLVEYLNQNEDKRPASEWNGTTNVDAGAIVAVNEDITILGSIKIEKDAEVTVLANVTVSGTLTIDGKLTIGTGGRIILAEGGTLAGPGAKDLKVYYPIIIPEINYGKVTVLLPFALAGEKVTITVIPDTGCRLKENSLFMNSTKLTPKADGTAVFTMPAATARIKAEFEMGLKIEGSDDAGLLEGKTAVFKAVFPPDINTEGASYRWTCDDRIGAVSLSGTDTAEVTVKANKITDDIDVQLTVTATLKGKELTASRTIHVLAIKPVQIKESISTPFRPGEKVQLTALVGGGPAAAGEVNWNSRIPSVADVNQNGLVTFKGAGTTLITAALSRAPQRLATIELRTVIDAAGSLTFEGGGKAAYRAVEIKKNGGAFKNIYTDADGKFQLLALEPGSYEVSSIPYTPGYDALSKTFTVKEGDSSAKWDLSYAQCATGTVRCIFTDTTGAPISSVRTAIGCETPYQSAVRFSDEKGECLFEGLTFADSGTLFRIDYSTSGGDYGNERLTLKPGETVKTVEIKLPVMSSISGRVTDLYGTGISGLTVQVAGYSAVTGGDGAYSVRGHMTSMSYPIAIASWEKYFTADKEPSVDVIEGSSVVAPDIKVLTGIDVTGRVLLDGRTDNYKKAYVSLYNRAGTLIAGGYAAGDGVYSLQGAVRATGNYRLAITQIYDMDGWYSVDYNTSPVSFTVGSLTQDRVAIDLSAQSKLKTSEIFRGAGNTLTASTQLASAGGKFELTGKYKNGGSETVTAVFETSLSGAETDKDYKGGEYGKLQHIVTLAPGQSGSFLIKAITDKASIAAAAETKVTVNGQTFDFAKLSIDIANITLSADHVNLKTGEGFKVYGEAAKNSQVILYGPDNKALGTAAIGANAGRWYTMELKGFEQPGVYTLRAEAKMGKENVISDPLKIEVSENPIRLSKVSVDTLDYDDLPINSRVGVRSFSHMLNVALEPEPLCVRSLFENDGEIESVVYHFAGNSYEAERDSKGRWAADINNWRGTGLKKLTALVKSAKSELEFAVAEVTVLVDPSGHIVDADTGLPVSGTAVTCQVKNEDGSYSRWDNEPHGQPANPWITGQNGNYGWHVPDGVYRVDVEKEGYEATASTELAKYRNGIEVPPPALDVNFALIPTTPMELLSLTSEDSIIAASFSRHVKDASVRVQDETGAAIDCLKEISGNSVKITGEGLADGRSYIVTLINISPKSGTKETYSIKEVTGTIVFKAMRQPDSGSNGSSSAGSGSHSGGEANIRQNPGVKETDEKAITDEAMSQDLSILKLTSDVVRKAPRVNGSVVIQLTGSSLKIKGKALVEAMGGLDAGETLTLVRKEKNLEYSYTINPKTLGKVPKTVNFALKEGNKKIEKLFSKHYLNKIVVLELGQKGSYGFTAQISVKANLKGIDPKTLVVYSYNTKTNSYTRLSNAAPYLDKSGSLHLRVSEGGTLILSDSVLMQKYELLFQAAPKALIKSKVAVWIK